MSVVFDESADSPKGSYQGVQYQIKRHGMTSYLDIEAFRLELMPPSIVVANGGGQFFGAPLPNDSLFRVTAFEWHPFGAQIGTDAFGMPIYSKAEWDITYQVPTFNVQGKDPVPMLQHEWSMGGEFLTIPEIGVSFDPPRTVGVTQNPALGVQAGFFVPTAEMSITWERVTDPPFEAIRQARGKVNADSYEFKTGSIYAETLMFLGAQLSQQIMSNGDDAYKVVYKFSERTVKAQDQSDPGGWNHFYRKASSSVKNAGFYRAYRMCRSPDTGRIYETTDFDALFQSGTTQ